MRMCLTRTQQNSDVNIIKKQNLTKTRINKEKGTYRLLKKRKFVDVLGNFQQILDTKRSKTQE